MIIMFAERIRPPRQGIATLQLLSGGVWYPWCRFDFRERIEIIFYVVVIVVVVFEVYRYRYF